MAAMVRRTWDVVQPLLFGLIGAEIVIANLNPVTVGENQHFLSSTAPEEVPRVLGSWLRSTLR